MRNSFIFYASYSEAIKELSGKDRLQVIDALIAYAIEDRDVALTGIAKAIFTLIKPTLDANIQRYENGKKGAEYGARGGRPKKKNPIGDIEKTPKGVKNKTPNKEKEKEYISTSVLSACARGVEADDPEEVVEGYLAFLKEHPSIVADTTNPSLISTVDYKILAEKIAESRFLKTRQSLSWLIANYHKIQTDTYKDFNLHEEAPPYGHRSETEKSADKRIERERYYAVLRQKAIAEAERIKAFANSDEEFYQVSRRIRQEEVNLAKAEVCAPGMASDIRALLEEDRRQLAEAMKRLGISEEDLEPKYTCQKCSDTGFLPDGRACDCYEKQGELTW